MLFRSTEMFAPEIHKQRLASWPEHYAWIEADGLHYFRSRVSQARRDVEQGLAVTLAHFTTPPGASAVIYGQHEAKGIAFQGVNEALRVPDSDVRLFGKPESFARRRMGVALATGKDTDEARGRAKLAASKVVPVKL